MLDINKISIGYLLNHTMYGLCEVIFVLNTAIGSGLILTPKTHKGKTLVSIKHKQLVFLEENISMLFVEDMEGKDVAKSLFDFDTIWSFCLENRIELTIGKDLQYYCRINSLQSASAIEINALSALIMGIHNYKNKNGNI